jgi:splicing factor 3A subunit 1
MSTAVETAPSVDVSDVEKAKQGKVTGVIIPPPEIRAVVDKTAQFVARNGKSFEQRILSSGEGKTAKFNFMKPYDPYHAYYEMKIRDFEEGKTSATPAATNGAPPPPPLQPVASQQVETTAAKATFTNPLARFAMNKPKEAPSPFEFSSGHPSGLRTIDIDVMKITAQYTALNGREFLSGLAQREARNPQFDFLKPTHMLFSYFTSLVDAYAKILQPSSVLLNAVKERSNRISALEKSVHRWAWDRAETERKKQEAQQADAERSAIQSIDWYDFVVVETIEFRDDELYEPAGMLSAGAGAGRADGRVVEEDMDMGDDMVRAPPPPPPCRPRDDDEDMDMTDESPNAAVNDDDDDGELNIVSDYKPRVGPAGLRSTKMVDPISGRAIPAEQMAEHMRIQLQDPKWRIEQQRFLEKQKESGMADSGSIAASLQQFAQQRGDIFGSAEEEEARLMMEESRRKKRTEVSATDTMP